MRAQGVGWATLSPLTRKEAAHLLGPKSNLCLEARPPRRTPRPAARRTGRVPAGRHGGRAASPSAPGPVPPGPRGPHAGPTRRGVRSGPPGTVGAPRGKCHTRARPVPPAARLARDPGVRPRRWPGPQQPKDHPGTADHRHRIRRSGHLPPVGEGTGNKRKPKPSPTKRRGSGAAPRGAGYLGGPGRVLSSTGHV